MTNKLSTDDLRKQFMYEGLHVSELDASPFKQFENWYGQVINSNLHEPGAMTVATVDAQGQPWQRIVLLKLFDENGFVFFTNYESRKAQQIAANSNVCLSFPWHALGRQVTITGEAKKISSAESLNYFATRARDSQIGAWASKQSSMISTRSVLETIIDSMKKKFENRDVPLPPFWGGYQIKPKTFEFWQARDNRLHDRFIYKKSNDDDWLAERLAP